ncbi:hypothetical protein SOCEGT47_060890 [Sorangium cellulosum]|uniref:PEGA domain-containing protein n=1 Tax=Sorangium cellulosum TaxID=56 RepID=A0A4V0NEB0_SORCE|nr:hypothetical protein [Sorangium cellulosum]AUX25542.1 hypothetical protein SOCEGT47_060890 [Sorangium cellulosum]
MNARRLARSGRMGALVVVALLSAASPRLASAQTEQEVARARALFIEGAERARQGRWEEARALYARSFAIKPAPITRYSLGVAQKETGRVADALASFRAFLAEPATPTTAPYAGPARQAIAALERRVGRATISVTPGHVGGLTLAMDGEPLRAASDQAVELDPGAHEIVARAPGFRDAAVQFRIDAGRSIELRIALTPETAAVHPIMDARGGLPPVAEASSASPDRTAPIVVMGVGAALFAGGAVLGLAGLDQASRAASRDGAEATAARTKGIVGDVLGGLGVATAGAGLFLLLKQPAPGPLRAGSVTPWWGPSGAGVALHL